MIKSFKGLFKSKKKSSDPISELLTQRSHTPNDFSSPGHSQNYSEALALASKPPDSIQTHEGLVISVVRGCITEQTVDVIVNSIGDDFDLDQGSLAKSILAAAGEEIQSELDFIRSEDLKYGDLTATNGYRLPCSWVFHGVLKPWNDETNDAAHTLKIFVKNCFAEADRLRLKSIAVPAIGIGLLGFPREIVVECLFTEAYRFSASMSSKSVREIRFVIPGKDKQTFEAFHEKLKRTLVTSRQSVEGSVIPATWKTTSSRKHFETTILEPTDSEFIMVSKKLMETKGRVRFKEIVQIVRIENRTLYQLYSVYKKGMEQRNGCTVENERMLWHGTVKESLDNICISGFNRSYCGVNGHKFGRGNYFAQRFSYSADLQYSTPDEEGIRYVFLCQVLTGSFATGSLNMIEPDVKPGAKVRHDSAVDDTTTPTIFVIFKDVQAYPTYLIRFN